MKPAYQFIIQTLMVWLRALQNQLGIAPTPTGPSPLIPRQALMAFPNYEKASISPDGKYLAYLKFNATTYQMNLWLLEIEKFDFGLADPLAEGRPLWSVADPGSFQWLYDGKTVMTTGYTAKGLVLRLLNVETSQETESTFGFMAMVKGLSQLRPQEVLVQDISAEGKKSYHIVHTNGDKKEIPVTGDFKDWVFDHNFQPKVGFQSFGPDGLLIKAFKKNSNGSWQVESFWETKSPVDTYLGAVPTKLNLKGDAFFWVNVEDYKYGSLMETNLPTGQSKLVFSPEKGDVLANQIVYDPRDQTPAWVATEYDKQKIFPLKSGLNADIEALNSTAPGIIYLKSASTDFNLWLVQIRDFNQVPKWFLYNRKAKKAQLLFKEMEELSKLTLNQMYPIEATSSDGLKVVCQYYVPAWLDVNKNGFPASPIPTIIFTHGGPWFSRASWDHWRNHQLVSNRGFVSMECNYRGGGGYGKDFVLAGKRQAGLKIIDDIIAGLDQLVKLGVTDPNKVAVWGESFGGYSTSVLQVRYPDRFKCAIPVFGGADYLQNLLWRKASVNLPAEYKAFDKMMVLNDSDPKDLTIIQEQLSPVFFLSNITNPPRPMLILHGLKDVNVQVKSSEDLAKGLKKLDIPVTFTVFPEEAHGFMNPFNIWAYHALVENFLHRCVGAGRIEPLNMDFPYSKIQIRESGIFTELKSKEVPWSHGN